MPDFFQPDHQHVTHLAFVEASEGMFFYRVSSSTRIAEHDVVSIISKHLLGNQRVGVGLLTSNATLKHCLIKYMVYGVLYG
jgi:hypothetical protein